MDNWKNYCVIFICALILGFFIGSNGFLSKRSDISQKIPQSTTAQINNETKTETKIIYVPKETVVYVDPKTGKQISETEKTDLEANIGKQTFNIKINGKETEIQKADNERFVFDKNKIVLDQMSTISINAKIDPVVIDKTKHWGIGVGYGSKNAGVIIAIPINKKYNLDGWLYANKEKKYGGIILRF